MSKVIKISDELYSEIEEIAFKNGVKIKNLAEKIIETGISDQKKRDDLILEERGGKVKITWRGVTGNRCNHEFFIHIYEKFLMNNLVNKKISTIWENAWLRG